jgi:hypothetical protein
MDERLTKTDETETPEISRASAADLADEDVRGRYGEPWQTFGPRDRSGAPVEETPAEPSGEDSDGSDDPEETGGSNNGGIVGHLQNVAEPFADHIVAPVAGAIGTMIEAASAAWSLRESPVDRRLKRQAREPLLNLYEAYPEARLASPRELGPRFVPVEDIVGTAVAGIAQRGGDFLPLRPFRGENWAGRWQRIREANKRLQPLPPVDLIKFNGEYWVVDGHNRVAATLYANGTGLDAIVTELVPLDGHTSERPSNLSFLLGEADALRAAVSGRRRPRSVRESEKRAREPMDGSGGQGTRPTGPSDGGESGGRRSE